MDETRPDPDALLKSVTAEEARAKHGRLRIFFGASAGVGKTYSMLEAARNVRASGGDIVVGYVEPHGRVETEFRPRKQSVSQKHHCSVQHSESVGRHNGDPLFLQLS